MATQNNVCAVNSALLLVCVLTAVCVPADASPDQTKTVEFNVKPGGVVHTFSEGIVSIVFILYSQQTCLNATRTQSYSSAKYKRLPSPAGLNVG